MRPRLKDVFWERSGAELRLVRDAQEQLRLDDPDGMVELLLDLLCKGSRTPPELAEVVGVPVAAVDRVVDVLDRHRLLVDDERAGRIGADTRDRYADNLAFFDPYATLALGREDMLERLRTAHVLLLGLGGVNMTAAAQLCGLGVDRLTVVDAGTIVARDLGWQPLARSRDVGTPYGPESGGVVARGRAVAARRCRRLGGHQRLGLGRDARPLLSRPRRRRRRRSGHPARSRSEQRTRRARSDRGWFDCQWFCCGRFGPRRHCRRRRFRRVGERRVCRAGLPFVRAIIGAAGAAVYSVDPGRSGCVACMAIRVRERPDARGDASAE